MKKKEGKNEEKIIGVHLKATVSKGEKLVSNNGRLAMVSHHCLHLYITSISIHCKDRKKNTTIFFQTRSTYNEIHLTIKIWNLKFEILYNIYKSNP